MRITAVDTFIMWGDPRNWVFVKISTDEPEVCGWGEATLEGKDDTVRAAIGQLGETLIGKDPLETERLWQSLYKDGFWKGGVVINTAIAGIDQALWDIKGKHYGAPVYQLLGGPARDRIRLYTHVGIYEADRIAREAGQLLAAGFTALKTGAWATDEPMGDHRAAALLGERIAILRQAVGRDVDLMIDNHGKSRPAQAVRQLHAVKDSRITFFEEPVPPDNIEAFRPVRETARELGIDLATGERYFTKWQFAPLLAGQFVDVIQPDLCHAGGITEVKKIAALAEVHHVLVAPHNPMGPVSTAAAAHIGMSVPNFHLLEYVPSQPYRDRVVKEPWQIKDGYLHVPDTPGLGADLDEAVIANNPPRKFAYFKNLRDDTGAVMDI